MARPLALFQQTLALDSAIAGSRLPLVAISQGTGGAPKRIIFSIRRWHSPRSASSLPR